MKRTLITGIAVVGLALAVGWTAFAHGPQGYGQGYGPGYGHRGGGYGQMHQGYGRMGANAPDDAPCQAFRDGSAPLTAEQAKKMVEWRLERHGNTLLEVGQVIKGEDGKFTVQVITKDGGKLAQEIEIGPQTGFHGPAR